MKNPIISVVMPVYNGELYLKEAIDSVLVQTFSNFEFIIINDGSTDSTESIILTYTDYRIRYIKKLNSGVGPSLKVGCSVAKGKYIARMDADDICLPNRFEIQVKHLEKNHKDVLVSSAVKYVNENNMELGLSFPYTTQWAVKNRLQFGSSICHPAVMMRKESYLQAGGYRNLRLLEDLLLWINLSKQGRLINISTPLLRYRILENSVSHSIPKKDNTELIKFLIENSNNLKENNEFIIEFENLYETIKTKSQSNLTSQIKGNYQISSFSSMENSLYKLLSSLKISKSITMMLICKLKSYMLFLNQAIKINYK